MEPKGGAMKDGWLKHRVRLCGLDEVPVNTLLLGESISDNVEGHKHLFKMTNYANFGIKGDRIENVMWWVKYGLIPMCGNVFILVGTNNIGKNEPTLIASSILKLAYMVSERVPNASIHILGILPRDGCR